MDPKKVRGTDMPPENLRFQTPGGNALMYDVGMGLSIYTVSELKLSWWWHLGIINNIRPAGEYHCIGTDVFDDPIDEWLPLYVAEDVPILSRPAPYPIHLHDAVRYKRASDPKLWWAGIAHAKYKTLRITAQFAMECGADLSRVKPKFNLMDFAVWRKDIYCLDPFQEIALERLVNAR